MKLMSHLSCYAFSWAS